MIRWLLSGALLTMLAAPAAAAEARLMLSWNAPYGTSRARDAIVVPCDSAGVDTLYLSFDPGRDSTVIGMSATVYFHAAEGDTLGQFWKFDDMNGRYSPIRVSFDSDSAFGFTTPFLTPGAGQGRYDYVSGSGRVRMVYAIAANAASRVKAGHSYGLARLMVRRPPQGIGGCSQPMCVELHVATLAFAEQDVVDQNRGPRWVSINSPDGKVCETFRSTYGAKSWKPSGTKP